MSCSPGNENDQILLKKLNKGDKQAFTLLFRKYWAVLFDSAYKRLQSREQAEEVVQELFMDVWQRRASLNIHHAFGTYLSAALKYKVLNQMRNQMVKDKHLHYIKTRQNAAIHPIEEKVYYDELHTAYENVLHQLPEKCRVVFHLRRHEHRSFREIASQLNISESTAEKHMVKALKLLRAGLKDYVVTIFLFLTAFLPL